jgi:hypothetical protein
VIRLEIQLSIVRCIPLRPEPCDHTYPFRSWGYEGRRLHLRVDKVQPDSTLAYSARLSAIQAVGHAFVALQMAFSASQAASAHPLWLSRGPQPLGDGCVAHRLIHDLLEVVYQLTNEEV